MRPNRERTPKKTQPRAVYPTERPNIDIPEDFYLIQDTREQIALFEPTEWIVEKGLKTGDYSVLGFESKITIERKSIPDLFGSLGGGRGRFEREIERMTEMNWCGLMIEGEERETMKKQDYSTMVVNQIYHALSSYEVQGIHIYYARDKDTARDWVLSRLTRWYMHVREGRVKL